MKDGRKAEVRFCWKFSTALIAANAKSCFPEGSRKQPEWDISTNEQIDLEEFHHHWGYFVLYKDVAYKFAGKSMA
eukprot:5109829-Amphidinium_carterae.1